MRDLKTIDGGFRVSDKLDYFLYKGWESHSHIRITRSDKKCLPLVEYPAKIQGYSFTKFLYGIIKFAFEGPARRYQYVEPSCNIFCIIYL